MLGITKHEILHRVHLNSDFVHSERNTLLGYTAMLVFRHLVHFQTFFPTNNLYIDPRA